MKQHLCQVSAIILQHLAMFCKNLNDHVLFLPACQVLTSVSHLIVIRSER